MPVELVNTLMDLPVDSLEIMRLREELKGSTCQGGEATRRGLIYISSYQEDGGRSLSLVEGSEKPVGTSGDWRSQSDDGVEEVNRVASIDVIGRNPEVTYMRKFSRYLGYIRKYVPDQDGLNAGRFPFSGAQFREVPRIGKQAAPLRREDELPLGTRDLWSSDSRLVGKAKLPPASGEEFDMPRKLL